MTESSRGAAGANVQTSARRIVPTVGRIVLFHPSSAGAESGFAAAAICAAVIAFVHSDSCVNLAVFDANGVSHSRTSVPLIQDGEAPPELGYYAEWMPFQKGQAVRTEQLGAPIEVRIKALEEALAELAREHSKAHHIAVGDMVIVREPHHADAPGIVTAISEDGRITCNVFRGDHVTHVASHLEHFDAERGPRGWLWLSEVES